MLSGHLDDRHTLGEEKHCAEDHGNDDGNHAGGDIATAFCALEDLLHRPSLLPVLLGKTGIACIQGNGDSEYTKTLYIGLHSNRDLNGIAQLNSSG